MTKNPLSILLILFAFSLPFSKSPLFIFALLIVILWIFSKGFTHKYHIFLSNKILWILPLIGVSMIISALFSYSIRNGFLSLGDRNIYKVIISHFVFVPFVATAITTTFTKREITKVIPVFLSSMFISMLLSYAIFWQLIDIEMLKAKGLLYRNTTYANPTPFMNHILYSIFLAITSIFLLDSILKTKKTHKKIFLILFFCSITINLFINGGRAGQVAFILALFTYIFTLQRINLKKFFLFTLSAMGLLLITYTLSTNFQKRVHQGIHDLSLVKQGTYNSSLGIRLAMSTGAIRYLTSSTKHFIFGAGAGDARNEYLKVIKSEFTIDTYHYIESLPNIHNQYLQFWIDGSILSLLLFLLYIFLLLKLPVPVEYRALLNAYVVIFSFVSITNNQIYSYPSAMLFMLLSAFFIIQSLTKPPVKAK